MDKQQIISDFISLGYKINYMTEIDEFRCSLIKDFSKDIHQEIYITDDMISHIVRVSEIINDQAVVNDIQTAYNNLIEDYYLVIKPEEAK